VTATLRLIHSDSLINWRVWTVLNPCC